MQIFGYGCILVGAAPSLLAEVEYSARTNELRKVGKPRLFEIIHQRISVQPRLFELVVLGESGWLKAVRQKDYAPRKPQRPQSLQQVLFAYTEAVQRRIRRERYR